MNPHKENILTQDEDNAPKVEAINVIGEGNPVAEDEKENFKAHEKEEKKTMSSECDSKGNSGKQEDKFETPVKVNITTKDENGLN